MKFGWVFAMFFLGLLAGILGCSSSSQAPVITLISVSPAVMGVGDVAQLAVSATDPSNKTLSYTWTVAPVSGSFTSITSAACNWTATSTGNFEFSVAISNGSQSTIGTQSVVVDTLAFSGSNPVTADSNTPAQVTQLRTQDHNGSEGILTLSWYAYSPPTDNSHYLVYQSSSYFSDTAALTAIGQTSERFYNVGSLSDGVAYYYAVTAVDTAGNVNTNVAPTLGISLDDASPAALGGLSVKNRSNAVDLTWTASGASDLSGYNIYRSTSSSVTTADLKINSSLISSANFTDATATNNSNYYYCVTAMDDTRPTGNESVISSVVLGQPIAEIPNTPASPNVFTYVGYLLLSWTAVEQNTDGSAAAIAQYNVYRSEAEAGPFSLIASVASANSSYQDNATGIQYYYKISAVGVNGAESTLTGVFTSEDDEAPGVPEGLVAEGNVPEDGHAHLEWSANDETDLAGYKIYMAETATATYNLVAVTPYNADIIVQLTVSDDFFFRISAYDYSGNESDKSLYEPMYNTQPTVPVLVSVNSTTTQNFTVTWTQVSGVAGYRLFRSSATFASAVNPALSGAELVANEDDLDGTFQNYTDTDIDIGQTYYYRILSVDAENNRSTLSNELSAREWSATLQ